MENMTTAVTPNSRQYALLKEEVRQEIRQNMFFYVFTVFVVFCPFLRSWRPGKACKGFLEAVRFDSIEYEPVGRHGDPKRIHFHHFPDHPTLAASWCSTVDDC